MKRVGLVVAYDGTKYSGWQTQPNGITIQGVLNDTLSELLGEKIETIGASWHRPTSVCRCIAGADLLLPVVASLA